MGIVLPRFFFTLDTKNIEEKANILLSTGGVIAVIYNDARSAEDFPYWFAVNDGRGPVRPVHAKVLHWVDASGKDVFSMYSRGVAPRHIRERAIPDITNYAYQLRQRIRGPVERGTLVEFVNELAKYAVQVMQDRTPVVTGKLKSSYRIVLAE